jgi:hypothetical protein
MLDKAYLNTLFTLNVDKHADSVIVFAEVITPRLEYVCQFIFNHVLHINFKITNIEEKFQASDAIRINYSVKEFQSVFQIFPQGLLSETEISEIKPKAFYKENAVYFYQNLNTKGFSYDVFAAVFYFVSRYEEWQTFEKDQHRRFEAKVSLLWQHKNHLKPIVDIWINELANSLKEFNAELKFPKKEFKVMSTIDVDNLYAFRSKGFIRTIGAGMKDILKFDFKNLNERIEVLIGNKKDPFDIYENVSDFCFENKIPLFYFFLFRTGTKHDKTVNPSSPAFKKVFQTIKENHAFFGLHPSYDSSTHKNKLAEEINHLKERADENIVLSRQHYLRFDIKSTPHLLMENGVIADFTMGYASQPGFRAGTTHPFYYYDFKAEKTAALLFIPFCIMDGVYTVYNNTSTDQALDEMLTMAKEIKKVQGFFISVFHERSFYDHLYKGFGTLYKKLHSELKELSSSKN